MHGLLLHSIDIKRRFNLSSYPVDKFTIMLDRLISADIKLITVSQISSQNRSSDTTAITFDDGLSNFYDFAYPLLQERGIKATIFPVAGLVGKGGCWDVMGKTSHMTAAMLREISGSGHEIGSHSLTHANLVWLDDNELMRELRDSKSILEDIIGNPVTSLSFPFGSWNARVWNAAKSAGYKYATAYRGHKLAKKLGGGLGAIPEIMPVFGVYQFDSVDDVMGLIRPGVSLSKIRAMMMSHFSKGTPIVKFRREYRKFP